MTIPDFQTMMRPVLAHLADGDMRHSRRVKEDMAEAYSLTQEERERLLPSGKQRVMDNRVSWALSYLVQAGLVERPQRGQVRITTKAYAARRTQEGKTPREIKRCIKRAIARQIYRHLELHAAAQRELSLAA